MKFVFMRTADVRDRCPDMDESEAPAVVFTQGELGFHDVFVRRGIIPDPIKFLDAEFGEGVVTTTGLDEDVIRSIIEASNLGWDTPEAQAANEWFENMPDLGDVDDYFAKLH
jgi:hypothetical protein